MDKSEVIMIEEHWFGTYYEVMRREQEVDYLSDSEDRGDW